MKSRSNGITLIALVITIVLLITLAGIVISISLKNNGLLTRAKQAKKETERTSIVEQIKVEILDEQLENELEEIDQKALEDILKKYGEIKKDETGKIIGIKPEGKAEISIKDIIENNKVTEPDKPIEIANKTYVTWEWNESTKEYEINDTQTEKPDDWCNYEIGKWGNIKTTKQISETEVLEAYWVWIPRYEYKVPTSTVAEEIDVRFIGTDKKEGSKGYTKQSDGTIKSNDGYTIHPAFKFKGKELEGIWVAKFQATSTMPNNRYAGGENANLKLQVIPRANAWCLSPKSAFKACREIIQLGGVLEGSSAIDTHMMKNIEWGAVAILSQSKYGVYNPESLNGEKGNKEYQVWNNPSTMTGCTSTMGKDSNFGLTCLYNSENGPKGSTSGTVYGIYDMAAANYEFVAGCLKGQETTVFGEKEGHNEYVDIYLNNSDNETDYSGAKIGDATRETKGWNSNLANFVTSSSPVFMRGGDYRNDGKDVGIFLFYGVTSTTQMGFRPVLIEK